MYDFITREEFTPLLTELQHLRAEVAVLRGLTDEYLSTAGAMHLLGCSRRWLEKERTRPGTLLVCSHLGSKPTYSRASLLAVQAARTVTPHQTA